MLITRGTLFEDWGRNWVPRFQKPMNPSRVSNKKLESLRVRHSFSRYIIVYHSRLYMIEYGLSESRRCREKDNDRFHHDCHLSLRFRPSVTEAPNPEAVHHNSSTHGACERIATISTPHSPQSTGNVRHVSLAIPAMFTC